MSRLLAVLLLLGTGLPCFVWFSAQQGFLPSRVVGGGRAPPVPYHLLNESEPPPLDILSGLPEDDAEALMDVRQFAWLLGGARPEACRQPDGPLVLVLVHTAIDHAEHRRLIRASWGAPRHGVLVRFLLGQPSESVDADGLLQHQLEREATMHGDLVQGSFVDSYRNMTYKHAMALKWFATHCPEATYLLKVDDDVMVNTPALLDLLRRALSPLGARRLLACLVIEQARPKRSWRSKWHVGFREYPASAYPTYCAGWAVLYSPDVAFSLYAEAQRATYFWIDDVMVTGVLAARLGLAHARWGEGLVLTASDAPRVISGEQSPAFVFALWDDVGLDLKSQGPLWERVFRAEETSPPTLDHPRLLTSVHGGN